MPTMQDQWGRRLGEVLDLFEGQPLSGLERPDLRKLLHVNSSTISLLLSRDLITRASRAGRVIRSAGISRTDKNALKPAESPTEIILRVV